MRSAGFSRLRVLDASAAVGRLRSEGFDVKELRTGTPDYVIPESAPFISVLRFVSVSRARVRDRAYVATVCNVDVYNAAPGIKVAQRAANRIVAALRNRCR